MNPPFIFEMRRIAEPAGGVYGSERPTHEKLAGVWMDLREFGAGFQFDPAKGQMNFSGYKEREPWMETAAVSVGYMLSIRRGKGYRLYLFARPDK